MPTRRKLSLQGLPFYAEHPALMSAQNMRWRFGKQVP